ncbi:MAG: amino acid ABC transporter permease [Rhodospirillaceae bacterium]|jgi:polar amino acid transport system permease protein|nr:amino acid ABC transporter permease [Rhodospirillaceae bacterium]
MKIDWKVLADYLPDLLSGAQVTLAMTGLSLVIGSVVGLGLALARISGFRILSWPAYAYIEFFRTTPPLVQIIWFYFVLPVMIGIELDSFTAASAALGLNIAAFLGEIFRSGIQGIDVTQRDAANVLGLSRIAMYRYVVLPQAVRIVLPPTTTTVMLLLKSTALASAIGALELTRVGQLVSLETFRPMEVWTSIAIIYFVMTYPIALAARYLERRMRIGQD